MAGIETFFYQHIPGDIKAELLRVRAEGESVLKTLSKLYQKEASTAVKQLTDKIHQKEGNVFPDFNTFSSHLSYEDFISLQRNMGFLRIGCALPVIEDTSKEGWVETASFTDTYNFEVGTTLLPKMELPANQVVLTPNQWGAIDLALRNDNTFGWFVEDQGIKILPEPLLSIMEGAAALLGDRRNLFVSARRALMKSALEKEYLH